MHALYLLLFALLKNAPHVSSFTSVIPKLVTIHQLPPPSPLPYPLQPRSSTPPLSISSLPPLYAFFPALSTETLNSKLKKRRVVNPIRPVLKGITGFSLTALRQSLRALTGISLSKVRPLGGAQRRPMPTYIQRGTQRRSSSSRTFLCTSLQARSPASRSSSPTSPPPPPLPSLPSSPPTPPPPPSALYTTTL